MLGGHINPDSDPLKSSIDDSSQHRWRLMSQLRKLFWLCYSLDVNVVIWTGQPPSLNPQHCDLTLPLGYADMVHKHATSNIQLLNNDQNILYPSDLRLVLIMSRTYDALYSVNAMRKSDVELLKDIRELDEELEKWRLSLPVTIRPMLRFSESNCDTKMSMQAIILNLQYYNTISNIHQAAGRCQSWRDRENSTMEGLSTSLALSIEASRSSLVYLHASAISVQDDHFW